ncbi:MAG: hypothetical protein WCB02_05895 [Bradyrhizobium sp.]
MRFLGAAALTLAFTSVAPAAGQSGVMQRMSCAVVRFYVARYSASTAEMWARSHGATEAQIGAARRCLKDMPAQTAQAVPWLAQ